MSTVIETAAPAERPERIGPPRRRRWRPAEVHLVSELPRGQKRAVVATLVVLAALPVLSAAIVLWQGWQPAGDNALIGLRIHDVLTGEWPLIGQPTTGENFGSGIPTSHPGPIEFYLVAPLVFLLGPTVGLAMGAGFINAAAMATTGWLAHRRGGIVLLGLTTVATLGMTRSLGGNLLHDPVSSNVGSLASFALLFAAWSIVAGDLRTLPVFVALGTFALQDHLAYLGTASPVVLLAIVVGTWWIARITRRDPEGHGLRPILIGSVVAGVVLWLPVIIDEIWGNKNIDAIFQTFTGKRTPGEGATFAIGRLAEALAPVPLFARRVGPLGYLHTPSALELAMGLAVLGAIVAFGVAALRRRTTAHAAFVAVTLVASAAGTYAAVKLPVGAGIQGSNLRWMWTVGAFAWIGLAWMIWQWLPTFWREVLRQPAMVVGAVLALAGLVGTIHSVDLATDRDGPTTVDLPDLIDRLDEELPKGTYRVTYEGGSVVVGVGPAIVHALDHRGDTIYMDIGPFTRAYADHRAYEGQPIDGTLVITAEAAGEYPAGTRLLARQEFEVNRKEAQTNTVRIYLVQDDG